MPHALVDDGGTSQRNMLTRLLRYAAKEIGEIAVSLVLMGSLIWSLYEGSVISWAIFGLTLSALVFGILRPKKAS